MMFRYKIFVYLWLAFLAADRRILPLDGGEIQPFSEKVGYNPMTWLDALGFLENKKRT